MWLRLEVLLLPAAVLLASPAVSAVLSGKSLFEFSDTLPSGIVADLQKLQTELCGVSPDACPKCEPNIPSQGEWVLKIGPPSPATAPPSSSVSRSAARGAEADAPLLAPFQEVFLAWPTAPWAVPGSEDLPTICGRWSYELILGGRRSKVTLVPQSAGASQGIFFGVLHLGARMRFSSGSRVIEFPLDLSLALAGQWATLPPSKASSVLGAGSSNLILFAHQEGDRWMSRPACAEARDPRTRLCFEASAQALEALADTALSP